MNLEGITVNVRERQILYDLTFMNYLKFKKKKKKKLIETESRLVVARSRQWGLEGNGSMSKKVETYQLQRK